MDITLLSQKSKAPPVTRPRVSPAAGFLPRKLPESFRTLIVLISEMFVSASVPPFLRAHVLFGFIPSIDKGIKEA